MNKKYFKTTLIEFVNESNSSDDIKSILLKRIPFLKDYNIFTNPRHPEDFDSQRIIYNDNVDKKYGDDIYRFKQFNVSSSIRYLKNKMLGGTFHTFVVRNEFHFTQPENMDDLTFRILRIAFNQISEKLSYNKELRLKDGEDIPKEEMDIIINDMNKNLFEIEEYTKSTGIDLF